MAHILTSKVALGVLVGRDHLPVRDRVPPHRDDRRAKRFGYFCGTLRACSRSTASLE
jgi:hypothetical protein